MSRVPLHFGGGPVSIRLRSLDHCARRVRQIWQFRVRALLGVSVGAGDVRPAELLAGLDHPGGTQRSAICPSRQRLTLPACSRQTEIDSMQFVERSVRARVGGTPSRSPVSVSCRPSRRPAAAPGWVRSSSLAKESRAASASIADPAC
jgi:hypothetical protein